MPPVTIISVHYKRISPSIIRAALWIIARWNIRISRWAYSPFSRNAMRFQLSKWHPHFLIWLIVLAISTRMMAMSSATDDDDRDRNERNREFCLGFQFWIFGMFFYIFTHAFPKFLESAGRSSPCSVTALESSFFEIYSRLHYFIGSCFANLKSCSTRAWWDKSLFGRQYNGPLSNITVLGLTN